MDRSDALTTIREVAAEVLSVEPDKVTEEARFKEDLDADSLDLVELVMGLEERFDIEVPEDDLEGVTTIGQAVDSNVLFYERFREEVKQGRSIVNAMESGFQKAFGTIVDANLTTLIAAVILFYMGSGPVRGFAVTLSIGIVTTVFTAYTISRLMISYWLRRNRSKGMPKGIRTHFFDFARINFMLDHLQYEYPHEPVPSGWKPLGYLIHLVMRAAFSRYGPSLNPKVRKLLLEEFRLQLFAQEIKTIVPVSPKRLEQVWATVKRGGVARGGRFGVFGALRRGRA